MRLILSEITSAPIHVIGAQLLSSHDWFYQDFLSAIVANVVLCVLRYLSSRAVIFFSHMPIELRGRTRCQQTVIVTVIGPKQERFSERRFSETKYLWQQLAGKFDRHGVNHISECFTPLIQNENETRRLKYGIIGFIKPLCEPCRNADLLNNCRNRSSQSWNCSSQNGWTC